MSTATDKQEPLVDLIRSMTKAEKRNFKLYATRLTGNGEAKFVALFDMIDSSTEYNEAKIIAKCNIKREQLPNTKAHLYKQLLISLRLLSVQRSIPMQLREQIDFAKILYDRGLYKQSYKIIERVHRSAEELNQNTMLLDIIEFEKQIENINLSLSESAKAEKLNSQADKICERIEAGNTLADIALRLYSLYLKLGYARSQKDLDLINVYFKPRLEHYAGKQLAFSEQYYFYQCMAWYNFIQHKLPDSYRYASRWVLLFDATPKMKEIMYDAYLFGYAQILNGLFLMRKRKFFAAQLVKFEHEAQSVAELNENAYIIAHQILYINRLNSCFLNGTFVEGVTMIPDIDSFIAKYSNYLAQHTKLNIYYKIACIYFGNGQHIKCIEYLNLITTTKEPQLRRDLQCFAKILTLIASYEAGIDHNIDYQIRSVYAFLVKMNDMQNVQREMLGFLKRLGKIYQSDLKDEFRRLYERLLPYENHPYERRVFYYLDVISWLESKITGRSISEVIQSKLDK